MSITISTTDYPDEVRAKLQQEERYFKSLGIDFNIDENKSKEFTLFEFNFKEAGYLNYNEYLADIVAEVVIDDLEKKLIDNIIKHKYNQFTKEEKLEIQKLSLKHLDELNMTEEKLLPKIVRKKEIIIQLLKYLEMHRDLNIEGFVRFRLKNYLYKLKLAVEQAVDDLIIEKEYVEFIDLLKYFVDLQEPKIDLVNVLKNDDGNFILLDKNEEIISNEYLEGFIAELMDEEVEFGDLLISALINIAPDRIILHFDDKEIEETVKQIFGDRVDVCPGCDLCKR